ncbi:hypothetical protein ACS0TY_001285 [Phlomoides rotata]
MLVLDGCFIIELIGEGRKNQNDRTFHGLERDLVLLENQISFFVLCELFDHIERPDKHTLLMRHVLAFCRNIFPGNVMYNTGKRSEEVEHILDLIHTNWYPFPHYTSTATQASRSGLIIHSVAHLKDVNVKFKKKEYDRGRLRFHTSRGTTVFDIELKEDNGVMLMPALRISDGTETIKLPQFRKEIKRERERWRCGIEATTGKGLNRAAWRSLRRRAGAARTWQKGAVVAR